MLVNTFREFLLYYYYNNTTREGYKSQNAKRKTQSAKCKSIASLSSLCASAHREGDHSRMGKSNYMYIFGDIFIDEI